MVARFATGPDQSGFFLRRQYGGIAQLGERLHGMQEVSGSIPLTSTTVVEWMRPKVLTLSSRGLGHHPFTVSTGVRIPVETPDKTPRNRVAFFFSAAMPVMRALL